MKKICLLVFILFNVSILRAQDSLSNITELQHLLQQRRDRFEAYASAADQRSGIFGNKTKKDLEESREILLEIVKTDNNILKELNQAIARRGMAKADYSYEHVESKQMIDRLTRAADTLNTQLIAAKEINAELKKSASTQKGISYLLAGAIALLSFLFFLTRRKSERTKLL